MCLCNVFSATGNSLNAMWGVVDSLWVKMGANSGQIQIIIAVVALILAVFGYFRVKQQITMAEQASKDAENQTKEYAKQVEEAAKQTQIAAKQFENSNIQIQELIDHRNLVLNIRSSELKSDYIKTCSQTIVILQDAVDLLTKTQKTLLKKRDNLILDPTVLDVLNLNILNIDKDLNDFNKNIKKLVDISIDLVKEGSEVEIEQMQENIYTINIMRLRAIRSTYVYPNFNNSLNELIKH